MKNFKKALASTLAVLSVASAFCVPMGAYAETSDDNLYVKSEPIPDNVVSYACDIFSRLSYESVENLDFTESEYSDMKLGKAFTITEIEEVLDDSEQYYFPVLSNNSVIATFVVNFNSEDNSMGFQFGKDELSESLNGITSSINNPVSIIMDNTACFAIDNGGNETLLYNFEDSAFHLNSDITKGYENLSCKNEITIIGEDNVYCKSLSKAVSAQPTLVGKNINVPFVDNKSVNKKGTCWASCIGSLASYYKNTSTGGNDTEAAYYRDKAIADYPDPEIDSVVSAISSYSNVTLTQSDSKLSWNTVKKCIQNNAPFYSTWITPAAGQAAHAMVINGYLYDKNSPTNTDYYFYYVMDPNKSTSGYQLISANGNYSINKYPYTWDKTVYKYIE